MPAIKIHHPKSLFNIYPGVLREGIRRIDFISSLAIKPLFCIQFFDYNLIMTKTEANIIIQACLKHRIFHTCRSEGDVYLISFPNDLDFRNFEAAKLAVNSMVLENRKKPLPQPEPLPQPLGLNFSRYLTKKKKDYEPGRWAELRQNENKE